MSDSLQVEAIPKVSVIIVNWNGGRFLERCLAALMVQTVRPFEIIVLDNASTDDSLEIVRRFPSVRMMALEQNTGFARGNNLAVAAADPASEWIALLNPDAYAAPDWLAELLDAARRRPEYDVFGSKLVIAAAPHLLDGAGDAYHMSGLVWRTGFGEEASAETEVEREIFSPCAAAALYRRSAFTRVGGFDEDYFCYVEDVDIGFRLRLAGYRCLYVPGSLVQHVGSGTTGGQDSDFSMYHGHRNLVWTFVKDMPGLLFWLLVPLHVCLNLVSLVWFAARHGRGGVIWRAKRDALKGLPGMWRKRQLVQKARVASVADIWQQIDKRLNITRSRRVRV